MKARKAPLENLLGWSRTRIVPAILFMAAMAAAVSAQTFAFEFDAGLEGWEGGYSDYSGESDFQFAFSRARLPAPLDTTRYGLKLNGMNRSDDMFMFLRRKIEGLEPGAAYKVAFKVRFASREATNSFGIGGSPGTSVFLKIGAVAVKPVDVNGRMNIDKGNQANPGKDMDTIGHVGVADDNKSYALIERSNAGRSFAFTAAADGTAWIVLGTDSGYEGLTTLYYQRIEAVFTRQGGTSLRRHGAVRGKATGTSLGAETGVDMAVTADGRAFDPLLPAAAGFRLSGAAR